MSAVRDTRHHVPTHAGKGGVEPLSLSLYLLLVITPRRAIKSNEPVAATRIASPQSRGSTTLAEQLVTSVTSPVT